MAASSMHKPGWRSRRRSRLSLVERAVPRLGRPAEPDDEGDGAEAREQSGDQPTANGSQFAVAANADLTDRSDDDREASGLGEGGSPVAPLGHALEQAKDDAAVGQEAGAGESALDAASTPPYERASVAALAAADAEDELEASSYMRIPPSGPVLELDWDGLIQSGFTDPRDRRRPLPKHMSEIVRALIRQALSDQSSWRDRVILVTSPTEHASKSAAAINFALGLTTVGDHHAVLVDVDTEGSGAVDRLGGGGRLGITAVLADEAVAIADLPIATDLDRLTLVASGAPDEETLDRFASRRMLQILRFLTRNPETILIIDAPPILVSQEAAVLSVVAGQVVMSVEAGRTTADQIEHALQRIGERHNVSLVLNESSGLARNDAVRATGHAAALGASRRVPSGKRRLPRATAATTAAVMVGLLGVQPSGHALTGAPLLADPVPSIATAAPPQRWSSQAVANGMPCRRDCR